MLKHYYSEIRRVSREVLEQFHSIEPERSPARRIRKLVASLRDVRSDAITRENCERWEDMAWGAGKKGADLIDLVFS